MILCFGKLGREPCHFQVGSLYSLALGADCSRGCGWCHPGHLRRFLLGLGVQERILQDPCVVVGVVPPSEKRSLLLALFGLDPLFVTEPLRLRQDLEYVLAVSSELFCTCLGFGGARDNAGGDLGPPLRDPGSTALGVPISR